MRRVIVVSVLLSVTGCAASNARVTPSGYGYPALLTSLQTHQTSEGLFGLSAEQHGPFDIGHPDKAEICHGGWHANDFDFRYGHAELDCGDGTTLRCHYEPETPRGLNAVGTCKDNAGGDYTLIFGAHVGEKPKGTGNR